MKRGLFSSLWLKFFALMLSVVMWFVVADGRREGVSERVFVIPVALVRVPETLVIVDGVRETVSVRLRGPVSALRGLTSQNLETTLDLGSAQPGELKVSIGTNSVNVPPGVAVIGIEPSNLLFRLESRRQKLVPVRPFLVGQPPEGYSVEQQIAVPDRALISGPASLVRDVAEVATERIILTGRTAPFRASVSIVSDHPLIQIVEPADTQVFVTVSASSLDSPSEPVEKGTASTIPAEAPAQEPPASPTPARKKENE